VMVAVALQTGVVPKLTDLVAPEGSV